jgi:hypothetical protein
VENRRSFSRPGLKQASDDMTKMYYAITSLIMRYRIRYSRYIVLARIDISMISFGSDVTYVDV